MMYHNAVLLNESLEGLNLKPNGIYVDVTFGGGGHSKEIINRLDSGKLYAFDQDDDAQSNAINDTQFVLLNQNFRYLKKALRLDGVTEVDGVLADLGVSSHQFDTFERGFSIRGNGDLDMRMNCQQQLTASVVVNEYEIDELHRVLKQYGELKNAYNISKKIIDSRAVNRINTTEDLKNVVKSFASPHKQNKFFAQLFQAIRIEVNDEINALKEMLHQAVELLKLGGRLCVISYHSLEDRLVKNIIKSGNFEGIVEKDFFGVPQLNLKAINKKPIVASTSELSQNVRSRSAKLRICEKVA
ncbi:MAG: 16S rRNA (cytosine(1402)-N(4))-methyltransferase RsmH [Flavobacteriales bacterium]